MPEGCAGNGRSCSPISRRTRASTRSPPSSSDRAACLPDENERKVRYATRTRFVSFVSGCRRPGLRPWRPCRVRIYASAQRRRPCAGDGGGGHVGGTAVGPQAVGLLLGADRLPDDDGLWGSCRIRRHETAFL